MSILSLDHIAIAVEDLDKAVNWYVSALGFTVLERRRTLGENSGMDSAVLQAGNAIVVLVAGVEEHSQVSRFIRGHGPGVQHIAFAVDDIASAMEGVEAGGGASDTGLLCDVGIQQTFLRRDALSNVRIELIQRDGGTFSDASVERLFRKMEERGIY